MITNGIQSELAARTGERVLDLVQSFDPLPAQQSYGLETAELRQRVVDDVHLNPLGQIRQLGFDFAVGVTDANQAASAVLRNGVQNEDAPVPQYLVGVAGDGANAGLGDGDPATFDNRQPGVRVCEKFQFNPFFSPKRSLKR